MQRKEEEVDDEDEGTVSPKKNKGKGKAKARAVEKEDSMDLDSRPFPAKVEDNHLEWQHRTSSPFFIHLLFFD